MVTQITLGNFGQLNGKNVITGGASQLDTSGIIKALTEAKRAPAVRLETLDKTLDSQTTAFNELKTMLKKFQTAADGLRNIPGVGVDSKNSFQYRTSSLSTMGALIPSDYVSVTVQPGAAAQGYTIDSITQLAHATKQQSGQFVLADATTASAVTASGSPVAGMFQAGTFNLRAVSGAAAGVAVTLNQGDSLQMVVNKINEVSSQTGIQAAIITESTGHYRLSFSATQTGTTYGFNFNTAAPGAGHAVESDAGGVLSQISFNAPSQLATDAIFSVDGVPIQRQSNSIADAISGVTFNLKQPSPASAINVSIVPDTSIAENAINGFVDSYNEFRLFVSKQSQLDENSKPLDTAVLYSNSTLRTLTDQVSAEITRVVSGIVGSAPSQLTDIGLSFENFEGDTTNPATRDILTVDATKLQSALQSNFDGVRKVFEFQQTSDNANFASFKRSNNLNGLTGFTATIDQTTNTYTASYTDPTDGTTKTATFDYTAISGGGVDLKGQAGTIFEGSEFIFAVTGNATVNVSLTQGIADRFYNLINSTINDSTGTLTTELTSISDRLQRNKDEITKIDDKISTYRDNLVQQYANLESALTKANQLLLLLDAQSNARSSN